MTSQTDHIDEFESMFRRAEREPYLFEDVPIRTVALVTDRDRADAEALQQSIAAFLPSLEATAEWQFITGDDYDNVAELLEHLSAQQPNLIVTYRHLQERSLVPQHSLGVYLDVLTQATTVPVLVLPGTASEPISLDGRVCRRVMVVTDHISGDDRLINYGVRMCPRNGEVWLVHVEDDVVFERYMRAIEKIPEIETEQARRLLREQLLKEARDFIETCIEMLKEKVPSTTFHADVDCGHRLRQFRELVDRHQIDLLVANTKDDDQLAMHGMAYSLSVEMIDKALLLL